MNVSFSPQSALAVTSLQRRFWCHLLMMAGIITKTITTTHAEEISMDYDNMCSINRLTVPGNYHQEHKNKFYNFISASDTKIH
jgi:hypothetical protein